MGTHRITYQVKSLTEAPHWGKNPSSRPLGVTHSVSSKSGTYHGQFIVGTGGSPSGHLAEWSNRIAAEGLRNIQAASWGNVEMTINDQGRQCEILNWKFCVLLNKKLLTAIRWKRKKCPNLWKIKQHLGVWWELEMDIGWFVTCVWQSHILYLRVCVIFNNSKLK